MNKSFTPKVSIPGSQHIKIDRAWAENEILKAALKRQTNCAHGNKGSAARCMECLVEEASAIIVELHNEWADDLLASAVSETREKFIRCVWVVEREFGYGKAMRVVASNHPRFSVGTRFDYGFLDIALTEGYRVQIDPVPPHVLHDMEEARREREQGQR